MNQNEPLQTIMNTIINHDSGELLMNHGYIIMESWFVMVLTQ